MKKKKKESKLAAEELERVKESIKAKRSLIRTLEKRITDDRKEYEKFQMEEDAIIEIQKSLLSKKQIGLAVQQEIRYFKNLFSQDFYAEVQNHGLDAEKNVMSRIAKLARYEHVPLVATNDAHFAKADDYDARQFMKSLRFGTYEEVSESDKQLYLKSDKELYEALLEILEEDEAKEAILNIRKIASLCHVEIPPNTHYPKFRDENGKEVEDSASLLKKQAVLGSYARFKKGEFTEEYRKRAEYELDVIINLGYADYLLIVADFIKYARSYAMTNNPQQIGYGVGPGRGSGAGCLVNYLLGITDIDPLKYGLIFERFLNKDRVSMPDIDTDFSKEVREATIEYVKQKYGKESVAIIRTVQTQGAKAAIKNAARILGFKLYPGKNTDDVVLQKRRTIKKIGDALAAVVPNKPGISLKDCLNDLQNVQTGSIALRDEIISSALQVDGTITGLGAHAAGVIIGDGEPLKNYVPLFFNGEKKQWSVQCDMVEAEQLGCLKMDFLGLKNLDIISNCIRLIKEKTGVVVDPSHLPFEKEVFERIFATGNTNCVFQFESDGMYSGSVFKTKFK